RPKLLAPTVVYAHDEGFGLGSLSLTGGLMMHRVSKRVVRATALLVIAIAALVAATVGNSAATKAPAATPANFKAVLNAVKGLKPADRTAKLHELAAKEGQFNLYTSLSSTVTKPLLSAWAAAYPDVKLNLYRA